jgi:Fic family protein
MGRLWQTLILSQWQDIFSYLPVESLIYAHQDDYYLALQQSTKQALMIIHIYVKVSHN